MTLWKWVRGRQQGSYNLLTLVYFKWFDCHIIHYPNGGFLPPHKDPFLHNKQEIQHFRINFLLKKPKEGGEFKCRKALFNKWRVMIFNSARWSHSVTEITKGSRWILTFGFGWPSPMKVDGRYIERDETEFWEMKHGEWVKGVE